MIKIGLYEKKELEFAKKLGAIKDTSPECLSELLDIKNRTLNEKSYGKTSYDEYTFLRYFLARFKMDFVFEKLKYPYKNISEKEISDFYEENKDMFLRENGEYFPIDEIELVIKKRIREAEYEDAISDLLH